MVAWVVHAKEQGDRAEHAELAPSHIEVGIVGRILLEASHAVRPVAYSRQTDIQAAPNDGFKPLPLRAPVACPDKGIALYAGIALAGVVETAHAILPGKALVGSLGICDGK